MNEDGEVKEMVPSYVAAKTRAGRGAGPERPREKKVSILLQQARPRGR